MISIGHPIPDVVSEAYLPDGRIEPVSLAQYRGKWLVLFFWPLDFTFVCPTEVRAYSDLSHDFDLSGAALLGASVDSATPTAPGSDTASAQSNSRCWATCRARWRKALACSPNPAWRCAPRSSSTPRAV